MRRLAFMALACVLIFAGCSITAGDTPKQVQELVMVAAPGAQGLTPAQPTITDPWTDEEVTAIAQCTQLKLKRRLFSLSCVHCARAPRGESIEKRPEYINDRSEFGHWEMDLVDGRRGSKSNVLVLTERQTRQEITRKVPDKTDESVVAAIDEIERKHGARFKDIFKTITIDNGSEFADCTGMERSIFGGERTHCYYCHPSNPQEHGSNEKQNQMLRRWFPKSTSFDEVPDSEIERVTDWLNKYPRKLLEWGCSQILFDRAITTTNA